ncbi:MAG TPA: MBL fold metallo-hydrolase [Pyrinomonadaceae bacterium]|nr:MBL fold metallo-hydrolase [Pyrinomonadaceae bacterium]
MIKPMLSDEAFLVDVAAARKEAAAAGVFRLWWLGQAGFLLQWNDRHLLIDPYLSDSLTKKYAATDKPHVRMTERVIDPQRLDFIDAVTSSHNHTDHLDHETLWPLMRVNPELRMVIPEANRAFVAGRLGCDPSWPLGCDNGLTVEVNGFALTGVASAHESLEQDEQGRYKHLGYLIRFGRWAIYHSGDAVPYDGMAERLRSLNEGRPLDVVMLPINGRLPARRVPGNFFGDEAASFAKSVSARLAVPMHYEMFEFNTATPDLFAAEAKRIGQPYRVLRCGERWTSG